MGGPQPIRPEAILAWLEISRTDDLEERDEAYQLIGALDQEWLSHYAETHKRETKKGGT